MVLSDLQMLEMLKQGRIIIDPFDETQLATSSYDMRLGIWACRQHFPEETGLDIYNPYNKKHVDLLWGEPFQARPALEVFQEAAVEIDDWYEEGIFPTDLIFLIPPNGNMLCHTDEFIGGVRYHTSMMKARSTWGRNLIEVCKCAGWGDVGYFSRWTMEVKNNSDYPIPLVVGDRIAQLAFLETGPIIDRPYSMGGKYQQSDILQEVKDKWHPSQMKPRQYADRDIQKRRLRYEQIMRELGEVT